MASNPFGEVADRLKMHIIEAFFVSHAFDFLNDHLQDRRAPHSGSIGIRDICQSFIGTMVVWSLGIFDHGLEFFDIVSVVLFCEDSC